MVPHDQHWMKLLKTRCVSLNKKKKKTTVQFLRWTHAEKLYNRDRSQGKASPRAVLVRSIRLVLGSSVETTAAPLTLRRAMYTQSHTLTVVQGGGGGRGWWTPPRFWYVAVYVAVLQQNFHMVLSILFVDLTFKSLDEIPGRCNHPNT